MSVLLWRQFLPLYMHPQNTTYAIISSTDMGTVAVQRKPSPPRASPQHPLTLHGNFCSPPAPLLGNPPRVTANL